MPVLLFCFLVLHRREGRTHVGKTRCFNEHVPLDVSESAVSARYDDIEVQRQAGERIRVLWVEVGQDTSRLGPAADVMIEITELGVF
jgi:hypothetical protein